MRKFYLINSKNNSTMSKRNLLNLILLIFIIILLLFVIYEPGKKVAKTIPTLTNLHASDISTIKITRDKAKPSKKVLEFKKTAAGWVMLKPYQLAANKFRIESILKILSTESLSQNNLETLQRETFGLAKPTATITFNNNVSIKFGHNKSLKHYRYVELDSILHMIKDTFYYQLTAKPESYVSHKLLPENSKITRLNLPNLVVENTTGKWHATPNPKNKSADSMVQLINEWQYSQAYDINIVKTRQQHRPDISIQL